MYAEPTHTWSSRARPGWETACFRCWAQSVFADMCGRQLVVDWNDLCKADECNAFATIFSSPVLAPFKQRAFRRACTRPFGETTCTRCVVRPVVGGSPSGKRGCRIRMKPYAPSSPSISAGRRSRPTCWSGGRSRTTCINCGDIFAGSGLVFAPGATRRILQDFLADGNPPCSAPLNSVLPRCAAGAFAKTMIIHVRYSDMKNPSRIPAVGRCYPATRTERRAVCGHGQSRDWADFRQRYPFAVATDKWFPDDHGPIHRTRTARTRLKARLPPSWTSISWLRASTWCKFPLILRTRNCTTNHQLAPRASDRHFAGICQGLLFCGKCCFWVSPALPSGPGVRPSTLQETSITNERVSPDIRVEKLGAVLHDKPILCRQWQELVEQSAERLIELHPKVVALCDALNAGAGKTLVVHASCAESGIPCLAVLTSKQVQLPGLRWLPWNPALLWPVTSLATRVLGIHKAEEFQPVLECFVPCWTTPPPGAIVFSSVESLWTSIRRCGGQSTIATDIASCCLRGPILTGD